jgi:hypothetical protein
MFNISHEPNRAGTTDVNNFNLVRRLMGWKLP